MKLNSLIIKNFRGYRDIKIPFNENLNLIIGRNDVGKSTILDALEIFFNNDKVKMEVSDLNIDAIKEGETEITIGATFILEGYNGPLF
ncbi:MAG: ATP-binding protein [Ignavibacteria bacterium]|nr:ATP-binding protein [Ignavibacteria bacterium]